MGEISFEDREMTNQDEPETSEDMSFDYWTLRDIIRNEDLSLAERDEAVAGIEKLAGESDAYAQYLMGKLWRDGPLLIPDVVNARYWFAQAAYQDHAAAQYALAKLYLSDDVEIHDA